MTRHETITTNRAGLIAAVFCTMLVFTMPYAHATALGDLAATMNPGEWKELSSNGFNNGAILKATGGAGSITEYTDEALRNPATKKIYIIGCARSNAGAGNYVCDTTGAEDARWVEYDENTNSWRTMPTTAVSPNVGFHSYDHAALDPATGDYYFREVGSTTVWRYRNDAWSRIADLPERGSCCGGIEWFPELGGLVFPVADGGVGGSKFYLYRPSSNSWQTLNDGVDTIAFGHYHYITEYSAPHRTLFIGGGIGGVGPDGGARSFVKMDVTGRVTPTATPPVALGIENGVHTIDPVSGNLVVFAVGGGTYEYSPTSDTWRQTGSHTLTGAYGGLNSVAVPIPEHGVIFVTWEDCSNCNGKVYLYRHNAGAPPPIDTTPPIPPLNPKVQ